MVEQTDPKGSRSVERALRLLHSVCVDPNGLTLTQATASVDLPTSTVARLLRSLESTSFVTRDAHGVYRAGVHVLQIGATAVGNFALDSLSAEHLRDLADLTGETAYLAVPDGPGHAVYLRQVESPRAIRHATWTGRSIATSGTALGSALDQRVNSEGYATSRATAVEPDAAAAAAPIFDAAGTVVGALSIIGPSFRLDDAALAVFGQAAAAHCRAISASLGHTAPS